MANLEVGSKFVFLRVSEVSLADARGANAKIIVCEESSGFASVSNVSERKTKCGTITNTDTPTRTVNVSGVAAGDLGANNVSLQQLYKWQDANTLLYFVYKNDVSGTIDAGEVSYKEGTLRISSVSETADLGEGVLTFDAEMAGTGTVSFDVPA